MVSVTMQNYQGRCHCGAVSFQFSAPEINEGLRCNCSICLKKGAVMSNFFLAPDELHIRADKGSLSAYQFETHTAKHFFCAQCGIYTFHQTRRKPGYYRVNLGCIENLNVLELPVKMADGAAF